MTLQLQQLCPQIDPSTLSSSRHQCKGQESSACAREHGFAITRELKRQRDKSMGDEQVAPADLQGLCKSMKSLHLSCIRQDAHLAAYSINTSSWGSISTAFVQQSYSACDIRLCTAQPSFFTDHSRACSPYWLPRKAVSCSSFTCLVLIAGLLSKGADIHCHMMIRQLDSADCLSYKT